MSVADLLAEFSAVPRLPGALCREQTQLFDEAVDDRQTHQAVALCRRCPALSRCAAWINGLPAGAISGVVAGQVHRPEPDGPNAEGHRRRVLTGSITARALEFINDCDQVQAADLAAIGIDGPTAHVYLRRLNKAGLINKTGRGRYTRARAEQ
ncbi:WhiB family transcriptional regulator [Mycobacterium camsae]|uniref:WhiB family transcriptional regulator n=1 Tax=Mycobacterium gordonae TaxID=1778 RepID=UPI00197EFB7D|nr:WhiB family transcriptional regulator [Mycobacterium gordonae]